MYYILRFRSSQGSWFYAPNVRQQYPPGCSFAFRVGKRSGGPLAIQAETAAKASCCGAPVSYGNVDSISEEEMKIYLYFLASDQLEGRNLPSRGFDTAALYVASHLAEWGLKPGGSTTNTTGPLQPYLMPFELVSKQVVPEQSKASITAARLRAGAVAARWWRRGRGGRGRQAANHRLRIHQGLDRQCRRPWSAAARGARCHRQSGFRRQRLRHQ